MADCICPPEPPIDYGRAWRLHLDADRMTCCRCGGDIRNDQLARVVSEFQRAAELREANGPIVPASWRGE
jgi:hypothetical protein